MGKEGKGRIKQQKRGRGEERRKGGKVVREEDEGI